MPLRTLLPSRPSTGLSHRRHSSIVEDGPSSSSGYVPPIHTRTRGSSLKRLSLSLSRTNDEPFPPFLTREPGESPTDHTSTPPNPSPEHNEAPKSASIPAAIPTGRDEEGQKNETHDNLSELPRRKPQRLSLLGMRHASDPQLSTRFRKEESKTPKDVARMYPMCLHPHIC